MKKNAKKSAIKESWGWANYTGIKMVALNNGETF